MNKDQILGIMLPIFRKNKIIKAGIFGSFAKGIDNIDSDLDILVELPKGSSLFDFISIKIELEERLNKKVDLVEYEALKPALKEIILNEEVRVYG